LNVKSLFALAYGLDTEIGMAEALKVAGLDLQGVHHRGSDDAENIAQLLVLLLFRLKKGCIHA
jgi:inhibitor of KinA sporulation pathway (predicted exonuclease)